MGFNTKQLLLLLLLLLKIKNLTIVNISLLQNLVSLQPKNCSAILAQSNLASKNDIANVVKKRGFDDKPKNRNKKITLNITKYVLAENELNEKYYKIILYLCQLKIQ